MILFTLKVMLNETIRNVDFKRNTLLQRCCDIVQNDYNIVLALQRFVALKIVPCNIAFKGLTRLRTTRPQVTRRFLAILLSLA